MDSNQLTQTINQLGQFRVLYYMTNKTGTEKSEEPLIREKIQCRVEFKIPSCVNTAWLVSKYNTSNEMPTWTNITSREICF